MSDTLPARNSSRTVTAFFDGREAAEQARTDLTRAGFPDDAIVVVGSEDELERPPEGFWEKLTGLFMPEDERHVYGEGLRRGGFILSVQTSETDHDRVLDILDRDGAVDLDERESDWTAEGWTRPDDITTVKDGADMPTPYRPADNSTAGFGGSYAGEDGLVPRFHRDTTLDRPRVRSYRAES